MVAFVGGQSEARIDNGCRSDEKWRTRMEYLIQIAKRQQFLSPLQFGR
jgi:hypothetical protein